MQSGMGRGQGRVREEVERRGCVLASVWPAVHNRVNVSQPPVASHKVFHLGRVLEVLWTAPDCQPTVLPSRVPAERLVGRAG